MRTPVRPVPALVAALIVGGIAAHAAGPDQATARKALDAAYNHRRDLYARLDFQGFAATLAPGFSFTWLGRRSSTNPRQYVSLTRVRMGTIRGARVHTYRIGSLRQQGPDAVVQVSEHIVQDTTDKAQKKHVRVTDSAFRETWTPVGKEWKLRSSEELGSRIAEDGKVLVTRGVTP